MTVAPKLLPLRIRLPYTTEEEFIDRYGSNVGRGGVFIATRALKQEGTALAFEFVLADGTRLLRGEGVVVKAQLDEGSGRSGMTVRFAKLDAPSKAFIDRMVARRTGEMTPEPRVSTAHVEVPPPTATPPSPPVQRATVPPTSAQPRPASPPSAPAPTASAPPAPQPLSPPPGLVRRAAQAPQAPAPPLATPPSPSLAAPTAPRPAPARPAEAPQPLKAPTVRMFTIPSNPSPTAAPAPPVQAPPPTAAAAAPATSPLVEREPAAPSPPPEPRVEEAPAPRPQPTEVPRVEAPVPPPPSAEDPRRGAEIKGRRRTVLEVPVSAPVAPTVPEVVLGIDVGTSQARVAVLHEGTLRLIPVGGADARGIPSALAVDDSGQLLVGAAALAEAERAPRHAAVGLKRLLGLRASSPRLRSFVGLPFSVMPDSRGDAGVELHGRVVPLTDFAAQLLRELKSAAASFLGREATRAVLCVPAYFDTRQRAALREAGERAGLQILRVLNAPAAATLAYGHGRGLARKRVLVVDLGGGGFEASVIQVTGDDLEIVTTGTDPTLGGMDFDARIAEALLSELRAQGASTSESPVDWGPLRTAAESAKVTLSEQEETPVQLREGAGPTLSRERVEALTADLAQRVTEVTREVLESSSLTPQGLDAVVLVGGQGRAPLVRRRLEESLGVPVRSDVDPLGAGALGAALLGHSLLEIESGKPGATVSDVLSVPLGVAERGGILRRVFERNTRLPADKTLVIPITPGPLSLALFQGASALTAENEYLGALHFQLERAGEAEIHFSLSQDGILSLSATVPGTKRQPVTLATEELDDAAREALIARSPFATEIEVRPAGLFSGLRKLFGKR